MNISDDDNNFSYRILFERVFDPIALYRIDGGRIVFEDVNPAYERVMKVSRDEVTGLTFDEVWPDSEPRWQQVITECLAQNRTMHCIGESVDTDSYLEAVAFPIPPGRAAVIFLDRTRLKKSDGALRKRQRQLQALAAKLTITEEATRRAIASDLHDRVGYELVNHLTILRSINSSGIAGEFRAKIQELMTITESIIAENRSLIVELSPPVLKEAGLTPALEELAENILTPSGVHWQIITKGNPDDLEADDSVCVILYRSARELLINAVKHSGASEVSIIINTKPELLTVAVEYNGKGFGVSESEDGSAEGNGFGLFSLRERLRALGGELRIVSEPNKGAMLIMSCPRKLKYGEFTQ